MLSNKRHAAPVASKPWQKKRDPHKSASPSEVKRVFGSKIFLDLGSPSRKPLNRGLKSQVLTKLRLLRSSDQKKIGGYFVKTPNTIY
jgi:hypothetical protein